MQFPGSSSQLYCQCGNRLSLNEHLTALQVEAIQRNKPLMIVGTPGRLAELSRGGKLLSHSCRVLVLDEVSVLPSTSVPCLNAWIPTYFHLRSMVAYQACCWPYLLEHSGNDPL